MRRLAWAIGVVWLAGCGAPASLTGCDSVGGLTPVCGLQNPEDLAVLPGGDWLVTSQGPGRDAAGSLLALRVRDGARAPLWPHPQGAPSLDAVRPAPGWGDPSCPGPPDAAVFAPHGLDLEIRPAASAVLRVVNHGGREAVELFEVGVAEGVPALWWRGCVALEEGLLNDVAALPDGGFVASRMFASAGGLGQVLGALRLALGLDTGAVLEWTPAGGWRELPETSAPAPNGVAVAQDGERVFVAVWGEGELFAVGRHAGARRLRAALPFHADNLSWAPDGRLLVAGQRGSLASIIACSALDQGTCGVPFAVAYVDPDSLAVEMALDHDGASAMGMATVAVEHDGELWIGTAAGDRVARFKLE